MSDIVYSFRHIIYFSFKDISLGFMLASNREIVYGPVGRVYFIEINIIFIHIKLGIVRSGFRRDKNGKRTEKDDSINMLCNNSNINIY